MPRSTVLLLTLATLAATAAAQAPDPASSTQSQPAPIERHYSAPSYNTPSYGGQRPPQPPPITTSQPAPGVLVRTDNPAAVQTVAADAKRTELRVEHGRATISVHDPATDMLILVDLPGGQTQLLKNGLYIFNADTNTVHVFRGEADAFAGSGTSEAAEPIKVKEDHQVVFAGAQTHATYSDPYYARKDYLPPGPPPNGNPEPGANPPPAYGYAPYGDGYYEGYPYYAYGYPYWGYPYFGLGWGWGGGFYRGFGGFRGGGFRGGFGGGFHGGRR